MRHALRRLLPALLGLAVAASATAQSAAFNPPDTSVQLFQWRWTDIATECTQWLGPQGYGAVQISPPQASKTANGWWGVYQPVNFVNLTSRMGDRAQLQQMIDTCHAAKVRVYADIVVNQMADGSSAQHGLATDGSSWNAATLSYPYFSANDFHGNCTIDEGDYTSAAGRNDVIYCRLGGLPDLATGHGYVQQQIVNYLRTLLDMGIDGFRIDAAKHQQPEALKAIVDAVKATHPRTRAGEPIWITQEVLPDGGVNRADYFGIGTVNEFQFTFAMRDVFRGINGLTLSSIPSVMGQWGQWGGSWGFMPPQHATILVNNWDTERNGSSLNASNDTGSMPNDTQGTKRYDLANIFMLAQGYGEAQVQSGFRFTNKDADRPAASPYANGQAQVNVVWDFVHRWRGISNMVKFRSAVRDQPQGNWTVGNPNQVAFSRGSVGFVALNNSGSTWSRSFHTGLPPGTYCNVIDGSLNAAGTGCTGSTVTVDASGQAALQVPADGGAAVPAVAIYTGQKTAGGGVCAVTFTIANANTVMGQNLRVVGNVGALGGWSPGSGFALAIQGSGANVPWSGTVNVPAGAAVQYKYVKWNGSTAVWESAHPTGSGNREFTACTGGSQSRSDGSFRH